MPQRKELPEINERSVSPKLLLTKKKPQHQTAEHVLYSATDKNRSKSIDSKLNQGHTTGATLAQAPQAPEYNKHLDKALPPQDRGILRRQNTKSQTRTRDKQQQQQVPLPAVRLPKVPAEKNGRISDLESIYLQRLEVGQRALSNTTSTTSKRSQLLKKKPFAEAPDFSDYEALDGGAFT